MDEPRLPKEPVNDNGPVLDGTDNQLTHGQSCWITVGNASVYIQHGSEGVGVTLFPRGHEDEDSITETWATWAEFEPDSNVGENHGTFSYNCHSCGRDETCCSTDPCEDILAERNK
jgi:hypothetical protein